MAFSTVMVDFIKFTTRIFSSNLLRLSIIYFNAITGVMSQLPATFSLLGASHSFLSNSRERDSKKCEHEEFGEFCPAPALVKFDLSHKFAWIMYLGSLLLIDLSDSKIMD